MQLSVIVPIFNEERILWNSLSKLAVVLNFVVGENQWGYVLVDNGSTDGTPEVTKKALQTWKNSQVVNLDRPDYGNALYHGLINAKSDYSFIINVDFWDPTFLMWAWARRKDYDLFLGSKRADPTLSSQSSYRRILSQGLNSILQLFFGFVGLDTHGQKLVNMKTMGPIFHQSVMRRGQYDTEFTIRSLRLGLKVMEAPVPYKEIRAQRNFMFKKIYQNVKDIFTLKKVLSEVKPLQNLNYYRTCRKQMLDDNALLFDQSKRNYDHFDLNHILAEDAEAR